MDAVKQIPLGIITQLRNSGRLLFCLYLPVGVLLFIVGLFSRVSDNLTLALLIRDPVISGRLPVGAGIISQIELVLWSASMTICAVGWEVLGGRIGDFTRARQFLLHFGIGTAVLFLDKMFMFHGDIAPKQLHVDGRIIILAYLIMMLTILYMNREEILSSDFLLLALALIMFGTSVFLDALPLRALGVPQFGQQVRFFMEDGSKFAGVVTWLAYLWRYTSRRIAPPPVAVQDHELA